MKEFSERRKFVTNQDVFGSHGLYSYWQSQKPFSNDRFTAQKLRLIQESAKKQKKNTDFVLKTMVLMRFQVFH